MAARSEQTVKIGLLGLGTVGSGVVNLLTSSAGEIQRRLGKRLVVGHASVMDLHRHRGCETEGLRLVTDPYEVLDDPEIPIVAELIGGYDTARELVLAAIARGKHVVTANKALLAKHGNEIFEAAGREQVMVNFEAAVAGGIPIIKTLRESLAGNRIEWLAGIVNGTANFILTEMRDSDAAFETALADAQRLGYAEADPTFDVEGIDAAHKLTIMGATAFGMPLHFDRVYTEGISTITREDIVYAEELGYSIKHLAIAQRSEHGVELRVHPTLIPRRRLLANVDGVMNAVLVHGDAVGHAMSYGAGAGAEPTASAVVADMIDQARALDARPENRVPDLGFRAEAISDTEVLSMEAITTAYYLRLLVEDSPGVMADITRILADLGISIEAIMQRQPEPDEESVPIIMLTYRIRERQMNEALQRIARLEAVRGKITRIRVEHFDA